MKKIKLILGALALISTMAFVGCQQPTTPEKPKTEAEIKAEKIAAFDKMFMKKNKGAKAMFFNSDNGSYAPIGEFSADSTEGKIKLSLNPEGKQMLFAKADFLELDYSIIDIKDFAKDEKTVAVLNITKSSELSFYLGKYFIIKDKNNNYILTSDTFMLLPFMYFTKMDDTSSLTKKITDFSLDINTYFAESLLNGNYLYSTDETDEHLFNPRLFTMKNGTISVENKTAKYIISIHPETEMINITISNSEITEIKDGLYMLYPMKADVGTKQIKCTAITGETDTAIVGSAEVEGTIPNLTIH